MMHERGKSDTVIVAVKPANVAERSGAERVEQRRVTEGNVDQQPTCRTQSRAAAKTAQGDVSQELARIRRVASRNGEERFTALLHHVSTGLLEEAFFQVREDAAPGVDGLTWKEYEQSLEGNLVDLHCSYSSRNVSGTTGAAGIHTQAGRPAAAVGDCGPGR